MTTETGCLPKQKTGEDMTDLLVNIDHVATLRNARREHFPDPVAAAVLCETAGADGIVFHLREDRRHINDRDVARLKECVRGKLDFELSVHPDIVAICAQTCPHLATLVPERRDEVTTEGGLDAAANSDRLRPVVSRLLDSGIEEVALFIDPEPEQVAAAHSAGANAVELHTGDYAAAASRSARLKELERLSLAAAAADELGLRVHAGHGLDYQNCGLFMEEGPQVCEVSIGFAIVARSLLVGLPEAVREMRRLVKGI